MGYSIVSRKSLSESLREVALEQLAVASREVDSNEPAFSIHVAVHQLRKRCKKMRALLRLLRPASEEIFSLENSWYRDSAARFSEARDLKGLLTTFASYRPLIEGESSEKEFKAITEFFESVEESLQSTEPLLLLKLQDVRASLLAGRERVERWNLKELSRTDLFIGLQVGYRKAKGAMTKTLRSQSATDLHEWRKQLKYHRLHLRLCEPIAIHPVEDQRQAAAELGMLLGECRDLEMLQVRCHEGMKKKGYSRLLEITLPRRKRLLRQAKTLGLEFFQGKAKSLVSRYREADADNRSPIELPALVSSSASESKCSSSRAS